MIEEVWKDVVGYEDRYQVSNLGRVRSKDVILHKSDGKIEFREGKIVKLQLSKTGYLQYLLATDLTNRVNLCGFIVSLLRHFFQTLLTNQTSTTLTQYERITDLKILDGVRSLRIIETL